MDFLPKSVATVLPYSVLTAIKRLERTTVEGTSEIRLRAQRPVALSVKGEVLYLTPDGAFKDRRDNSIVLGMSDISESFQRLCGNSVYSHEEEIRRGFITLAGGHRAGFAGNFNYSDGRLISIREIGSINIRIAREIKGAANRLLGCDEKKGILIAGPPGSGKTTVLRDYIRQISDRGVKVTVIDSRNEIAAASSAGVGCDIGLNTDIITGAKKSDGIEIALRTLSPEIIAFDEIASEEEIKAVSSSISAGAGVIATVHAGTREELCSRQYIKELKNFGFFKTLVLLSRPGEDIKILNFEEIFDESDGIDTHNTVDNIGRICGRGQNEIKGEAVRALCHDDRGDKGDYSRRSNRDSRSFGSGIRIR